MKWRFHDGVDVVDGSTMSVLQFWTTTQCSFGLRGSTSIVHINSPTFDNISDGRVVYCGD